MMYPARAAVVVLGLSISSGRSLAFRTVGTKLGYRGGIAKSLAFGFAMSTKRTLGIQGGSKAASTMSASSTTCSATATATGQRELYDKLCEKLREVERLSGIQGLLSWDEQVMMPPGANGARANQKTALAGILHEKRVDPDLGEILRRLGQDFEGAAGLSPEEAAVVRDAARDYRHETRKTKELAAREADTESRAYAAWVDARKKGDWTIFAPLMQEVIDVRREVAEVTRPELESAYEGCVDQFERGMSSKRLKEVFDELKVELVPLFRAIQDKVANEEATGAAEKRFPKALHNGPQWDRDQQAALCKDMAERLGFDMNKGRLDVSVHPFTGGPSPSDVRITTRYSENWVEGVSGTVHEVGHALYEQGRPGGDSEDLPVSRALSMGVHESQSLLWERMVFLSLPFWKFAAPLVHQRFPHTAGVSPEAFHRGLNRVAPGFIRVDADEVTYPLHIILRFEIEQGLMDGSIQVPEVPEIWNAKMKELLGIDVSGDSQGCLQDIHWSVGALGYFPSYTLGAIMACQFFEAAKRAMPGLEDCLARGEFEPLKTWLNKEVHARGSLFSSPDELLEQVTGEAMRPRALVDHLRTKYTKLYDL